MIQPPLEHCSCLGSHLRQSIGDSRHSLARRKRAYLHSAIATVSKLFPELSFTSSRSKCGIQRYQPPDCECKALFRLHANHHLLEKATRRPSGSVCRCKAEVIHWMDRVGIQDEEKSQMIRECKTSLFPPMQLRKVLKSSLCHVRKSFDRDTP